ncbi:aldehyde dehydrogenase (NADP(+)) [Arenibacter sp. M-2]|uniref:aldehyde dehydrogenase (NADP(+)) n=1 Tax=Arenibacter sp. M-2 TaxID=3053612 RepID=UPI00257055C5|nr:aldehyde dehydrogenase (NADP(+)) [Arenibacter sp. M-2]MDL5511760.1 aldehyde dehydrogenase (NADP(+)) [Arenibacter sp. M-2]|tara:strand:+ start:5948 stop:7531 length:1584 start_codon:yes stop_codon:yes gene_type:complete
MITGKNYIGLDTSAKNSRTYSTFNPKLNKPTEWIFHEASKEEVNAAIDKAAIAFETYRTFSDRKKAEFLRAIASEIEALGDELISVYVQESGLPEGRAKGERGRTMGQLRAFATLLEEGSWVEATIDTAQPDREPLPKADIRKMLLPLGPIVVFGASNFPLAFSTAGGDTASALAAGCPVIVKSHPMHAGTGELVASAIAIAAKKTGMPDGVFSNLNSSDLEVGQLLTVHPKVKGIGFTGSTNGGMALYRLATQRKEPIPVFAEMGSINPVVVLPSALEEKGSEWASQYAGSIMLGAGQFCTNPGLIIGIKGQAMDSFTTHLGKEIEKLDPTCMLHPNIHEGYEKGKKELSSQPNTKEVASFKGQVDPNFAEQKVLTVAAKDFLENPVLHREVFGPFSIVVQCQDKSELATVIQHLEGQLTGTILGTESEIKSSPEVVNALVNRVGRIIFNGVPTGVEVCPSMMHGGPFPSTTDSRFTSVGTSAIKRWVRPVSFQSWPEELLPEALRNNNPLDIMRLVNGEHTKQKI